MLYISKIKIHFYTLINMKKIRTGILLGAAAGAVDVTPMIILKLTWDANLSAFTMWLVIGFLLSVVELKMKPVVKGIFLSFLVLSPVAVLIAWKEPVSLIHVGIMTTILGGLLGFFYNKLSKE